MNLAHIFIFHVFHISNYMPLTQRGTIGHFKLWDYDVNNISTYLFPHPPPQTYLSHTFSHTPVSHIFPHTCFPHACTYLSHTFSHTPVSHIFPHTCFPHFPTYLFRTFSQYSQHRSDMRNDPLAAPHTHPRAGKDWGHSSWSLRKPARLMVRMRHSLVYRLVLNFWGSSIHSNDTTDSKPMIFTVIDLYGNQRNCESEYTEIQFYLIGGRFCRASTDDMIGKVTFIKWCSKVMNGNETDCQNRWLIYSIHNSIQFR